MEAPFLYIFLVNKILNINKVLERRMAMLDLKKLRSNTEEVKKALSNRGEDFDVNVIDEVIALDEERRKILVDVEALKETKKRSIS